MSDRMQELKSWAAERGYVLTEQTRIHVEPPASTDVPLKPARLPKSERSRKAFGRPHWR